MLLSKGRFNESDWKDAIDKHLNNSSFLSILYTKATIERYRLEYQQNLLSYVEKILISLESELELKTKTKN